MKKPELADLGSVSVTPSTDQFHTTIVEQKTLASSIVRRTFSLESFYAEHIEKIAAQLSQERRKPVSASQALRVILKQHMESQKI